MEYVVQYEHLEDEMITSERTRFYFNKIKESANKYKIELSDDEFKRLFKLRRLGHDAEWLINKMGVYKMSLVDALISYLAFKQ